MPEFKGLAIVFASALAASLYINHERIVRSAQRQLQSIRLSQLPVSYEAAMNYSQPGQYSLK